MGIWLEIVTLLVPGFNGSDRRNWRELAEFIASVSPEIPWHVTAFHKDYRMENPGIRAPERLLRAGNDGREGLKYVYAGNIPGGGRSRGHPVPPVRAFLIDRFGYFFASTGSRLTAPLPTAQPHSRPMGPAFEGQITFYAVHPRDAPVAHVMEPCALPPCVAAPGRASQTCAHALCAKAIGDSRVWSGLVLCHGRAAT